MVFCDRCVPVFYLVSSSQFGLNVCQIAPIVLIFIKENVNLADHKSQELCPMFGCTALKASSARIFTPVFDFQPLLLMTYHKVWDT